MIIEFIFWFIFFPTFLFAIYYQTIFNIIRKKRYVKSKHFLRLQQELQLKIISPNEFSGYFRGHKIKIGVVYISSIVYKDRFRIMIYFDKLKYKKVKKYFEGSKNIEIFKYNLMSWDIPFFIKLPEINYLMKEINHKIEIIENC